MGRWGRLITMTSFIVDGIAMLAWSQNWLCCVENYLGRDISGRGDRKGQAQWTSLDGIKQYKSKSCINSFYTWFQYIGKDFSPCAKTNIKKQARARRCSHKPWVSRHRQVFASDSGFRTDSYSIWRYPSFLCLKSAGSSHRNHIPLTEEGPAEGSVDATTCAQVRCAGAAVVDELKKVS